MKKEFYATYFKNKKITVMGLGVLGRGLQVTKFLADCGANVTVTDLKSEKDLAVSIRKLKKYKINYVLGKHDIKDFENIDMVVKSAGVPLDSKYILHAKKLGIKVVMDASLFGQLVKRVSPQIKLTGITGTRGKSMTTALIYHILKNNENILDCNVHLGGNMRMKATLPLIQKVKPGDIVVLELDSWQCQGFGDEKISPNIAVFTSFMPDHMNYYKNSMNNYLKDKCNIFSYQKPTDLLITSKKMLNAFTKKPKGRLILNDTKNVKNIDINIFGEHNFQNASYAYDVARECGLSDGQIKKTLKSFSGLEGRLENLRTINSIHIINDNNATTPDATIAGIQAVKSKYKNKNIILLTGGSDKKLDVSKLALQIKKYCSDVILLPGTGTEILKNKLGKNYANTKTLKEAVDKAMQIAKRNDVVLFSPGFASFGLFKHEYDRNDQFIKIINKL